MQEVFGKLLPTIGVIPGELKVHDRLVAAVESDIRRIQMLASEWRRERLELPGVRGVGDLYLELRLLRGEVVRLLKVIDAGQLEEDLVLADRLNHRLRDAETVDATVDDTSRAVVVVGDTLPRRDLAGVHLEQKLRPALEVKPEVCLDLLIDLDRAQVEADAGAARRKRERELMLRDVEEHRQHKDHEDEPWEGAIRAVQEVDACGAAPPASTCVPRGNRERGTIVPRKRATKRCAGCRPYSCLPTTTSSS